MVLEGGEVATVFDAWGQRLPGLHKVCEFIFLAPGLWFWFPPVPPSIVKLADGE